MTLKHFIERPVLASVISIVIVIGGLIGLATLPVEQYPDIAPPTVMVRASYPGASAETIQKSVIVPLEQAINGVEDMTYMTSSAALGSASVTVYFRQGTDPDMAAVNVQNKVSRATGQLPSEVTQIGVTTMKRQTSMVKIFSLYSPDDTYDETFLSNYSKINIEPRILRIAGVGEARSPRAFSLAIASIRKTLASEHKVSYIGQIRPSVLTLYSSAFRVFHSSRLASTLADKPAISEVRVLIV